MSVIRKKEYICDCCGKNINEALITVFNIGDCGYDVGSLLNSTFTLDRWVIPIDFMTLSEKCICKDCILEIRKTVDKIRES